MKVFELITVLALAAMPAAAELPIADIPPGHTKTFLVIHPHHDDHSWDYGQAGLITKLVDAGWTGYYIRVSNDEKDGPHGYPHDDMVNLFEAREATENLGITDVISLNWRNDYMDAMPINEIRAQLILLIRKFRPGLVTSYLPWGHYDRNPDHRKVATAVGEAVWLASFANVHPEHRKLGLRPYRVPNKFYSQRFDYGKGYEPNVIVELSESNVRRKARSYWVHRNVRLSGSTGRRMRALLKEQGLEIPELEGLSDIEAHARMQEWSMYDAARKVGRENGVEYGEMFSRLGEWHPWPGLKDYLESNAVDQ
ncbi:MAG: PIG-L family deacetylase [Acidobacteria bacterium]|nr:PIG-L family deacetylase [Acidobacteriota bacterium]